MHLQQYFERGVGFQRPREQFAGLVSQIGITDEAAQAGGEGGGGTFHGNISGQPGLLVTFRESPSSCMVRPTPFM